VLLHAPVRSVLVGEAAGLGPTLGQVTSGLLAACLRDEHGLDSRLWTRLPGEESAERSYEDELIRGAGRTGTSHALVPRAKIEGESLYVTAVLVEAPTGRRAAVFHASVWMDPGLAELAARESRSAREDEEHAPAIGIDAAYETNLAPSLRLAAPGRVPAVGIVDGERILFVVTEDSVAAYRLAASGTRFHPAARSPFGNTPRPVRCRDASGEIAMLDSDGDGSLELVVWSTLRAGTAAFSLGREPDGLVIERQDTFWLPWASTFGSAQYVPGTNYMRTSSFPDTPPFCVWKLGDLDGDGRSETVLLDANGRVSVRDSSMTVLSWLEERASALELRDMNGDGKPEIITASCESRGGPRHIVFWNWSDAGFREVWGTAGVNEEITCLAAGLLDSDEAPDLAVATRTRPRADEAKIVVLLTTAGGREGTR